MVQTGHNPFARETIRRTQVYVPTGVTCSWCGNVRRTKTGKPHLYQYIVEPDNMSGRMYALAGLYCSIGCLNSHRS